MVRTSHLSTSHRALSGGGEARHLLFQSHMAPCKQRDDTGAGDTLSRAIPPQLCSLEATAAGLQDHSFWRSPLGDCCVCPRETVGRAGALKLCNPGVKFQLPITSLHLSSFLS